MKKFSISLISILLFTICLKSTAAQNQNNIPLFPDYDIVTSEKKSTENKMLTKTQEKNDKERYGLNQINKTPSNSTPYLEVPCISNPYPYYHNFMQEIPKGGISCFAKEKECNLCDGAGKISNKEDSDCPKCKGAGKILDFIYNATPESTLRQKPVLLH